MALFPLTSKFQGDFVLQLLAVDSADSMDVVAASAARHSLGKRVMSRPGKVLRVRRQGTGDSLPRDMSVEDSGLYPTECIEVFWE